MTNIKDRVYIAITLAFFLAFIDSVNAQKFEVSPFLGYETGAKLTTDNGDLHIGDGLNFGGSMSFSFSRGSWIEVSYNHMSSFLRLDSAGGSEKLCDLATGYYSFGALQEFYSGGTVTPYALFSMGMVNYRPLNGDLSAERRMHLSLAGGVKIYMTRQIGFRLQARLLLPILYAGGYFETETGGSGYGITTTLAAVQGDFTAGVFFVLR